MDVLQALEYVRKIALEKEEYEQSRAILKSQKQSDIALYKMEEKKNSSWGISLYLVVFLVAECILTPLISGGLSCLLTLEANDWMTQKEFYEAGGGGYHMIEVIWPVGTVLGFPIALLIMVGVIIFHKIKDKRVNTRNERINAEKELANRQIKEQNEMARYINRGAETAIADIDNAIAELERQFKKAVPWYPVEYLSVAAVDFIVEQLTSGRASSVEQAIVQYQATQF